MSSARDSSENIVVFPTSAETPPVGPSPVLGSTLAWFIWLVSAIFVLFQFCLQLTSGVLVESLMKSFSLTAFGAGILASSYYYIYVLLQMPAGFLADRCGTRRILSLGAGICALGCMLFSSSNTLLLTGFGRLLMGGGASFAFVGCLSLISRWFPLRKFSLMVGVVETIGMFGSVFGGFFLAHYVQNFGWRLAIKDAGLLAIFIAILLAIVVRDAPKDVAPPIPRTQKEFFQEFYKLIQKPFLWLNGFYASVTFSIVTVFAALWAVPFMQVSYHLSLEKSVLLSNTILVGTGIGAPILGVLDSRFQSRRILLGGSVFLAAVLFLVLLFCLSLSIVQVGILLFLLGFCGSSYVLTFSVANQLSTPHTRSTAMGMTNMLSVLSAPIMQPLIGWLLYMTISGAHPIHNLTSYHSAQFQIAFLIFPFLLILAGIAACFLPNRIQHF